MMLSVIGSSTDEIRSAATKLGWIAKRDFPTRGLKIFWLGLADTINAEFLPRKAVSAAGPQLGRTGPKLGVTPTIKLVVKPTTSQEPRPPVGVSPGLVELLGGAGSNLDVETSSGVVLHQSAGGVETMTGKRLRGLHHTLCHSHSEVWSVAAAMLGWDSTHGTFSRLSKLAMFREVLGSYDVAGDSPLAPSRTDTTAGVGGAHCHFRPPPVYLEPKSL